MGGTFTDAALLWRGRLHTAKSPTTPRDQSDGVMRAVEAVLERARCESGTAVPVAAFAHGMTVATNALLEGRAARTVLLATEGFCDLVELGRQARPDLYRLERARPAALVPPERRLAVPERMGPDGPLRALSSEAAAACAEAAARLAPEAVAVVLLHAYAHPAHERRLGAALARALPGVHVSLSHEAVGTFREYERAATTEADAALGPLLGGYLRRLAGRCERRGVPEPRIMQSSGGLTGLEDAARHAARTVLSGPAGGAAGAIALARASARPNLLCFDMGGTSCDVFAIDAFEVRESAEREIAGRPLALPALDIHTVGAGGGSVAWRDAGGALRVGPRSAGADPGPACYGRGGREPTVTDANVVLGRIPADRPMAGVSVDRAAAQRAVTELGERLGLEPAACAEGIVRVADAEMARALRLVTVARGIDPRTYALMPFGGAGPLHAAALADELGIDEIVCPLSAGVLSAVGLATGAPRQDTARTLGAEESSLALAPLRDVVAQLEASATRALAQPVARRRVTLELRYRGQGFELAVPAPPDLEPGAVREAFEAEHERRYGYRDEEAEVELVTVRASVWGAAPEVGAAGEPLEPGEAVDAEVVMGGKLRAARAWGGAPGAGEPVPGPAIISLPDATVLVGEGWTAVRDADALVMRREQP